MDGSDSENSVRTSDFKLGKRSLVVPYGLHSKAIDPEHRALRSLIRPNGCIEHMNSVQLSVQSSEWMLQNILCTIILDGWRWFLSHQWRTWNKWESWDVCSNTTTMWGVHPMRNESISSSRFRWVGSPMHSSYCLLREGSEWTLNWLFVSFDQFLLIASRKWTNSTDILITDGCSRRYGRRWAHCWIHCWLRMEQVTRDRTRMTRIDPVWVLYSHDHSV